MTPQVVIVVAVMDSAEAEALATRTPLTTPVATIAVNPDDLRIWPFESILELYLRPAGHAVVTAWRHRKAPVDRQTRT